MWILNLLFNDVNIFCHFEYSGLNLRQNNGYFLKPVFDGQVFILPLLFEYITQTKYNTMKKTILFITILLLSATSCTIEKTVNGEEFKRVARLQGLLVEQRVGEKDADMGIISKYFVKDTIIQDPKMEIFFFEFIGDSEAKNAFNTFRKESKTMMKGSIEYGSPNDSGVFGNKQEYFALVINGQQVNLIRIGNTLAYSYTATMAGRNRAEALLQAIGYMDKKEKKKES